MTIYDRIKQLARRRKISIRELEMTLGFANGSMRKWTNNANPERLKKVADFFGTTPAYLRGEAVGSDVMDALVNTVKHSSENTASVISTDAAKKINKGFKKVIESEHKLPPYMALDTSDLASFPIIGTIKAGPNGVAYDDYMGTQVTSTFGLNLSSPHFYLKVNGDSMTGDGISDGEYALIEKTDTIEEEDGIYAVIYDGEIGTLKHVTKTKDAIVLRPSNPTYKPVVITGDELEDFHVVGKLKQVIKMF